MIDQRTFSAEWLYEKQKQYRKDPSIIESMIYALHLLEQLKFAGLDFIFKGGTSLILLLEKPRRFSVDIDIIVDPKTTKEELEAILDKVVEQSEFAGVRLDERRSYKGRIPKAHYIFTYRSNAPAVSKKGIPSDRPEREILLDVLFADSHYVKLIESPITTGWLKQEGEQLTVKMPDINSIAGDKLTAFAPNTTGVPYYRESVKADGEVLRSEMFMEVIKQLFDVGHLFDQLDDLNTFIQTYKETAASEIAYRAERNIASVEAVLQDTINTALILACREKQFDKLNAEHFDYLMTGLNRFEHYVFDGSFRIEHAQVAGAKAAYLAALILHNKGETFVRFDGSASMENYLIKNPEYNFLNKRLKFVNNGEALFYWSKIIELQHG